MWVSEPASELYVDPGTGSGTVHMCVLEPAPELYVDPEAGSGTICGSRNRLRNYPNVGLGAGSRTICGSRSRLWKHIWIPEPAPEYVGPGAGSGTICGSRNRLRNYPNVDSWSRLRNSMDPRAGSGTTSMRIPEPAQELRMWIPEPAPELYVVPRRRPKMVRFRHAGPMAGSRVSALP